jgi:hypothetical protein
MPYGVVCKNCGFLESAHRTKSIPHADELKVGFLITLKKCRGYNPNNSDELKSGERLRNLALKSRWAHAGHPG